MKTHVVHLNVDSVNYADSMEVVTALHTLRAHGFPFAVNPLSGHPGFNVLNSSGQVIADKIAVQVVLPEVA